MRQTSCPQEEMTLKAVRTRIWEGRLSAHVAGCAVCAEIVQVSRWMQGLAEVSEKTAAMPDGGRLWGRAQLSERQVEAERAQKILDWAEFSFALLVPGGLAFWIVWNWSEVQILLTSLLADVWLQLWVKVFSVAGATPGLFSFSGVILSLAAVVLVYPLLTRD
jgi:hypothetical protein